MSLTFISRSERNPPAELNLPAGVHGHCDGSELWRIHKAIRRAEISVIQSIEALGAYLQPQRLGQVKLARHGQIEQLHAGSFHRVAACVSKRVGSRSSKRRRIEPLLRRVRSDREQRFAGKVGAYGIL